MTNELFFCIICSVGFVVFVGWSNRQTDKILEIVVRLKDMFFVIKKRLDEQEERIGRIEKNNFPNNLSDIYTEKIENAHGVVVGYATKSFLEEIKNKEVGDNA